MSVLHKNVCCRYSLELPWRGSSNEYRQHTFLCVPLSVLDLLIYFQMLGKNREGIEDLNQLLKVDPKNTAAKKEMEELKKLWREV